MKQYKISYWVIGILSSFFLLSCSILISNKESISLQNKKWELISVNDIATEKGFGVEFTEKEGHCWTTCNAISFEYQIKKETLKCKQAFSSTMGCQNGNFELEKTLLYFFDKDLKVQIKNDSILSLKNTSQTLIFHLKKQTNGNH